MQTFKTEELGCFEITSGEVVVSDPCYNLGIWCQGIIHHVQNGTWEAFVSRRTETYEWKGKERTSTQNAILFAKHIDSDVDILNSQWAVLDFDIGVDSCVAGIYDYKFYRDDNNVDVNGPKRVLETFVTPGDKWMFSNSMASTRSQFNAGIIPNGTVSVAGHGDGSYEAHVVKNDEGQVIGIKIVFIDPLEPEDDFEDTFTLPEIQ